ncbi:DUF5722 domain-containing protein [Cohnella thailandensis]|uniref:DUF5722 domain-containing protein n=1 Tax=Cohnella thailandensis TaxID=557557 RepID=A0A841T813_9BACL|nr:DUF5722 domain-containing protein [Cohnella thailandensis]MBB6637311.1 hypothetical protein [Cohnella thailandensis]MBP1976639.1 hypothetical protein [Cohnella thailandensis]
MTRPHGLRKVSAFMSVILLLQLLLAAAASAGSYDPGLKPSSNVFSGQDLLPARMIDGFNTAESVAEWKPGTNTDRVEFKTSILNGPNSPYEGAGVLEQVPQKVKVYEWRTIYREYAEPLDLSGYRYLAFAANSWGWQAVDYMMKITLHSGDDTYESVAKIEHDSWSRVFVRLGDWDGRQAVTRIDISFMQNFDLEGVAPGAPGYDYWDGRFQIDSLSATNVRDLTFDAEGDTEGFASPNGTVEWSGGEIVYAPSGEEGVLESPALTLDTAKRNGLSVSMTNGTGASEMTVQWKTEGAEWNDAQAKTFPIPSSGTFTQDFNFSDRTEWSGTVTAFRFVLPASSGTLRIDQIRPKLLPALEKPYDGTAQARIGDDGRISIAGTVKPSFIEANSGSRLYLFELATYEDARTVLASKEPLADGELTEAFLFQTELNDGERSRLYSKFAVAAKAEGGEYTLVAAPQYVVNPEAVSGNLEPFPTAKSIKGLQVQMTGDAQELGISHAALNVAYNELTYKTNGNPGNTIPFDVEGKTYYLRKDRIEALDRQVKSLSDNGIIVSLILIMYNTKDANSANEYLIHPDSQPGGTVYALNTSNAVGVEYVKAVTKFLAERYSLPSQEHGRAVNYIVGNEIGQNMVWNNMGPKKMEDYVREYAQTLRLIDTIVKTAYANARTYVSLDHFWDENLGGDSLWKYDNKAIVDRLNELTKAEGGFNWNLAFHPYPEDLFDPRFWNDETATDSFQTKRITFKNLDVLVDYMKQPDYLFDGAMRRIILSEQGFHSLTNSEEDQKVQAAAYAYAYYKIRFLDGIDAFILHRHVDHGQEGGLNLGLWTHAPGTVVTPGEHKAIYDVFKYIDTERSLEATEFAKAIVGIGDWADAIPGFDPAELADRTLPRENGLEFVTRDKGEGTDGGFEAGDAEGFAASDEVSAVQAATGDAFEGSGYLSATLNSAYGLNWAGVQKTFAAPIDARKTPYFTAAIRIPNANAKLSYYAKFIAYSGNDSVEGTAKLDPSAGWQQLALPLKGWEGARSIDRVKIWVRSEGGSTWRGELRIDNAAFVKDAKSDKKLPNVEVSAKLLSEELEAGSPISVTVTNHGSSKLNKKAEVRTEGGLSVTPASVKLNNLDTGDSQTFPLEVTGYVAQEDADAVLTVKYEDREFSFVLKAKPVPVSLPFSFEGGDVQGWTAGENTASVAAVQSFANGPTKPSEGQYALAAHSQAVAADAWRTVKLELAKPLDLSGGSKLAYDIDSYGGVPGATYETRLTLKSGPESFVYSSAMSPDRWNAISADISAWAFRSSVTSIEISFRAAGSSMAWAPDFQVDNVRLAN